MVKILFSGTSKKKLRKELQQPPLGRDNYYDVEYLKDLLEKRAGESDLCRVRLVSNDPCSAYRLTIFRYYKINHMVETKQGIKVSLRPGWYVLKTWFVTKVNPQEFVWEPTLEENDHVDGNTEEN